METQISILSWQYLLFLLPLAFGFVLLLGGAVGLSGLDFGADVDADAEADVDADVAPDADHDLEGAAHASLLALLGVGRVPLSLLLTTALFAFGGVGIVVLRLVAPLSGASWAALLALGAALGATPIVTAFLARLVMRLVPSDETYAESSDDLIGSLGTTEIAIGPELGVACVLDHGGAQIKVRCRTEGARLERGERVLVTDYDPAAAVFLVERSPF